MSGFTENLCAMLSTEIADAVTSQLHEYVDSMKAQLSAEIAGKIKTLRPQEADRKVERTCNSKCELAVPKQMSPSLSMDIGSQSAPRPDGLPATHVANDPSVDAAEAHIALPTTLRQERTTTTTRQERTVATDFSSRAGSRRLAWTEVAPHSAPNNVANHNSRSDFYGCIFLARARAFLQDGPRTMDCEGGVSCLWLKLWSFSPSGSGTYLRLLRFTLPILAVVAGGAETLGYAIAASKTSNRILEAVLGSLNDVLLTVAGSLVLFLYHTAHMLSKAWRMSTHEHDAFLAALTLKPRWANPRTRTYKWKAGIAVSLWVVSAVARGVSLSGHFQEEAVSWFESVFEFSFFCLLSGVCSAVTVKLILACESLVDGAYAVFELMVEHDRGDLRLHKVINHWVQLLCAVRCYSRFWTPVLVVLTLCLIPQPVIELASNTLFPGCKHAHHSSELFPYLVLACYPALALQSGVEVSSACDSINDYASTMASSNVQDAKSKALTDLVLASNLGFSVAGERLGASRVFRAFSLVVWSSLVVLNAAAIRAA